MRAGSYTDYTDYATISLDGIAPPPSTEASDDMEDFEKRLNDQIRSAVARGAERIEKQLDDLRDQLIEIRRLLEENVRRDKPGS